VKRPGGTGDPGLAGLDEFRQGDVDDALAAGLGAGDAEQAVDGLGETLACRAGELVPEALFVTRRRSGGSGHFCLTLHVLARFVQAGLYHHLASAIRYAILTGTAIRD